MLKRLEMPEMLERRALKRIGLSSFLSFSGLSGFKCYFFGRFAP
jgi:hypothetical protein